MAGYIGHKKGNEVVAQGEVIGEITTEVKRGDYRVAKYIIVQHQGGCRQHAQLHLSPCLLVLFQHFHRAA